MPLSPAMDVRSPVHEADDWALSETRSTTDGDHGQPRVNEANLSSHGDDPDQGLVRQKRSDESEFDNVDAFDVDEDRLARVRIDTSEILRLCF